MTVDRREHDMRLQVHEGRAWRITHGETQALREVKVGDAAPGWIVSNGHRFGQTRNNIDELCQMILKVDGKGPE